MRRKTIVGVLLALSLIFNIFFIIGAVRKRAKRSPRADIARLVSEMNLDPQQQQRLDELRTGLRTEDALIRQQLHEVKRAIATQLDAAEVDADAIRDLMQRESDLVASRRETAGSRFGQFLDLLTPDQRRELGRRMGTHPGMEPPPADPPHLIESYDHDGDGRLNDAERAEAHRSVRHQHERLRHWRVELRAKFDANGNGHLESAEREAMRAWLLEQGFEPRPRDRQGSPSAGPRRPHMGPPRDGQPPRRRPGGPPTSGHPHPNAPPDQPSAGGTPTPE